MSRRKQLDLFDRAGEPFRLTHPEGRAERFQAPGPPTLRLPFEAENGPEAPAEAPRRSRWELHRDAVRGIGLTPAYPQRLKAGPPGRYNCQACDRGKTTGELCEACGLRHEAGAVELACYRCGAFHEHECVCNIDEHHAPSCAGRYTWERKSPKTGRILSTGTSVKPEACDCGDLSHFRAIAAGEIEAEPEGFAEDLEDPGPASTYPARWVSCVELPTEGPEKYLHLVRAPDDPGRLSRAERQARWGNMANAWRDLNKTPRRVWHGRIYDALRTNRRPRTFNALAVELTHGAHTADTAHGTELEAALAQLLAEGLVMMTDERPVLWTIADDRAEDPDTGDYGAPAAAVEPAELESWRYEGPEDDAPLVVLGCGKEKAEGRRAIVDLYTGPLYTDRLAAARALGGPHLILSAFHGARPPWYRVAPYDRTMPTAKAEADALSARFLSAVLEATEPGQRVIVLASAPYVDGWKAEAERAGRIVELPLRGLGMGAQRKRCRELADV